MEFDLDITKLGWFDKTIDNCTVATIPAGSTPKFIQVVLPGVDGAVIAAWWTGIPDLAVDDLVSVRFSPGNQAQYSVVGGGSGTAPATAEGVSVNTSAFDNNLSAADDTVQKALETLDELTSGSWPFDGVFSVSTTNTGADFASIQDANDDAGVVSGNTLALDAETFSEALTISKGLAISGGMLGQTIVTDSTNSAPTINLTDIQIKLSFLTVTHTGAGTTAGCVAGGSNGAELFKCVLQKNSGASGLAYGYYNYDTAFTTLRDCVLSISIGSTSNFGVYVIAGTVDLYDCDVNANGTGARSIYNDGGEVNVHGGTYYGDIYNNSGTLNLYGPVLTSGTLTISGGTATGWYYNASGNIVSVGNADIFPMGEGLGLFNREVNHWQIPAYHFNDNQSYATPPSPLAWRSGGGFSGAPSVANTTAYRSILELAATNAANQYFLYTTMGGGVFCEARLWPRSLSGLMVGVRLDDGSDNNYAEVVMQYSAAGVYKLTTRQRTGGGAVTSTDHLTGVITSEFVDLALAASGSVQYRINTPLRSPLAGVTIGWTPTHQGIVMRGSSATNYTVYVDWFNPI